VPIISIPLNDVVDWGTFHDVCARVLGFPAYYGRNMDAWVDCLTYADAPGANMVGPAIVVREGDILTLELSDASAFAARCAEQYAALIECSAFVNWRRIRSGKRPILALSFAMQ